MASSIQHAILIIAVLLTSFCFSRATAVGGHHSFTKPTAQTPPATTPFVTHDLHEHDSSFSPSTLFEEILTHLGFHELVMAVRTLSNDSVLTTANWNGPFTLFAPTDASIRSCFNCSVTRLLRQHIVPGLYSLDYLHKLAFGSKIETMDAGRCITVTSYANNNSKIYVNGVEITRPDLFNDGIVVVHGLQRHIAPLSPISCNIERILFQPDQRNNQQPKSVMRLMLSNAIVRLGNNGFKVLSNALNVKYAELINLQSMTVFAVDDVSIYSGGSHSYVSNIRFHIVPNLILTISDLEMLPVGTTLPSLVSGQSLAITAAASGIAPMRINYVPIMRPDLIRNLKIVIHSIYMPFPHLSHSVSASESTTTSASLVDHAAENNMNAKPRAMSHIEHHHLNFSLNVSYNLLAFLVIYCFFFMITLGCYLVVRS